MLEEELKDVSVLQSDDQRLKKNEKLTKTKEFEQVFRQGRKKIGKFVALHYIYNGKDLNRVGVTVSKRVDKKAVTRNRLKRIFRDIYRTSKMAFPVGHDFVLRALPKSANAQYGELRYEILSLAKSIRPETPSDRPAQGL
ncbi:MAG: ribonuclease P protein component [Denitrovibrio sp.]|nr:MAG: ribonuclease P protein component [Denitrovibrio sp.]